MVIEMKKLAHLPSRSGRDLQRYTMGRRQVVGCIPYRLVDDKCNTVDDTLQVLMVSSQKGETMMFPKGGWEIDESTMEEAASRECVEEAGVIGRIQLGLGKWIYKSRNQDLLHDGYMFPLLVEEQLDCWPEKEFRQRKWVTVKEAKELCPHIWMIEALELLVRRLAISKPQVSLLPCFSEVESSLYGLHAPLNRGVGKASSSSNISLIAELNLAENVGPHSHSFISKPREVESEASSVAIFSMHRWKRSFTMFQIYRATYMTTVLFLSWNRSRSLST